MIGRPTHGPVLEPVGGWRDGTGRSEPPLQVHEVAPGTVVIRQSLAAHYEAPFVYLLLGATGALLLDTGALKDPEDWPLRATVDGLVDSWLARHPCPSYSLTVAHSHGHGDHVAGDAQFAGRARTTVVGRTVEEVAAFFAFDRWPDSAATLDLGGRVLTVIPGPGHEQAAIVVHDPETGILLTGDTVYPGRLYVEDMPAYLATLTRLVALHETAPLRAVLGGHIEMSAVPGEQFGLGTRRHPDEARLALSPGQLTRLLDRVRSIAHVPGMHPFDDVVVVNGRAAVDEYFRAERSGSRGR